MSESEPGIPDPERFVSVTKAHLLHEQLEYSRENAEDATDEVDEAYQTRRVELCEEYIDELEADGLSESEVREQLKDAQVVLDETDMGNETPETARKMAEYDAAKQVLREYFGGLESDPAKLGDIVASSLFKNGMIEVNGLEGNALLEVTDEASAMALADTILHDTDIDVHEAAHSHVVME